MEAFIDIQNILAFQNESMANYTFKRNDNNTAFETTDSQPIKANGSNGTPEIVKNNSPR